MGNGSGAPLKHVTLANLTIAHAAVTFLEPYEVPSGGDWAVHRGAAVFLDGAASQGRQNKTWVWAPFLISFTPHTHTHACTSRVGAPRRTCGDAD